MPDPAVARWFADRPAGTPYPNVLVLGDDGESYVALIDSERLDYYHRLERERIHLVLLDDVERGLADVAAGRTRDAREALADLKRAAKVGTARAGKTR